MFHVKLVYNRVFKMLFIACQIPLSHFLCIKAMHRCTCNRYVFMKRRGQIRKKLILYAFFFDKGKTAVSDTEHFHKFIQIRRPLFLHRSAKNFGIFACADDPVHKRNSNSAFKFCFSRCVLIKIRASQNRMIDMYIFSLKQQPHKRAAQRTAVCSVNIPAGVDEGQIITIYNQGNAGDNGGPAGDLQLFVTIKPHKLFSRDGADLYIEVPISFTQAALGAEIDVPTLDKPLKYTVPEGTQPGTQFKVKGMGIPYVRSSNKGDLYITIRVEVPKRLTEKQKEILRIFDESTTGKEYEQKRSFLSRVKEAFGG